MKKIIFINQSTAYLMIDVVNAFTEHYDEVILFAGRVNELERPLNDKVKVKSIIEYNKKSGLARLFTWCWGTLQVLCKMMFRYKDYEVMYVTNPPMSYFISRVIKRPFSILVYDTYPDALKNIGIGESNLIYKWWSKINRKVFSKAKAVITLSDGMAENLTQYVDKERITIVPNWSASNKFRPVIKQENDFLKSHNLQDKFIVLYSGNMGYTHSVDVLVDVAVRLKDRPDICFLFIGEGKKKAELIDTAEKMNLSNCKFLPYQPADVLPYSLGAADLGVVTLNEDTALLSVPSKTYNLLAVGASILSISPEYSELAQLIRENNNGANFEEAQVGEIAEFILECSKKPKKLKQMSNYSLEVGKRYTYRNAEKYVEALTQPLQNTH